MAFTGCLNGTTDAQAVADALFSEETTTFRKGRIDSWREDFSDDVCEVFERESGELLKLWGYRA